MKTIPVMMTTNDDGVAVMAPAQPGPDDAIATVCDGENYIFYEPGDEVPHQFMGGTQ